MPTFIKPILRVGITLLIVLAAGILISTLWQTYVRSPWTRDGRVSADVVQIAPEVSGTIAEVAVKDNQFVRRGDVLYRLDPKRFALAVQSANADLEGRRAEASVKSAIARRRTALGGEIIATETIDQANGEARIANAAYSGSVAALDVARLNLERSVVRAPIDGYVTNLRLRPGDYAEAGNTKVAVVDSSSFWVTGYFEETKLAGIAPGMKARIRLMGFEQPIEGHVVSIGRGVTDTNEKADQRGLPAVNPVFTWIRLAQRIPVRVQIDKVPHGISLSAGMSCSIAIGKANNDGRLLAWTRQFL